MTTTATDLTRAAICRDRFDYLDWHDVLERVPPATEAAVTLSGVSPVGADFAQDAFTALLRAAPKLNDAVAPSHRVNQLAASEMLGSDDYRDLHRLTSGDAVGSAMALRAITDSLAGLYEKATSQVQAEADAAQRAHEALQELAEWVPEGDERRESVEFTEAVTTAEEATAALDAALERVTASVGRGVRAGVAQALEDAGAEADAAAGWGVAPGELARLDPAERLALGAKLRSPHLTEIAAAFGRFRNTAQGTRANKVRHLPDEIHDVTVGGDLGRTLPVDLVRLADPDLEIDFYVRFTQRQLLNYELRGVDKRGRGPVIYLEDGSGSMTYGGRHHRAKGLGLALAAICADERRPFRAICFGGVGALWSFDYPRREPLRLIEYAEQFLDDAGTDFMGPLGLAANTILAHGDDWADADVVMATDGIANVTDDWLTDFREMQQLLGFRVWGIAIGPDTAPPTMERFCDRVFTTDQLEAGDVSALFEEI